MDWVKDQARTKDFSSATCEHSNACSFVCENYFIIILSHFQTKCPAASSKNNNTSNNKQEQHQQQQKYQQQQVKSDCKSFHGTHLLLGEKAPRMRLPGGWQIARTPKTTIVCLSRLSVFIPLSLSFSLSLSANSWRLQLLPPIDAMRAHVLSGMQHRTPQHTPHTTDTHTHTHVYGIESSFSLDNDKNGA